MVNWANVAANVTNWVESVNLRDGNPSKLSRSEYYELSDYLCGNASLNDDDKKYVKAYMNKYTTKSERKQFELSQRIKENAEKPYTFDELQKALGKKSPFLITNENGVTILERIGLMKKNADGSYDISELSKMLQNKLPDMKMDRYFVPENLMSKYPDADINNIRDNLDEKAVKSDIENPENIHVSNRDITKLVQLCGFEIKNHIKGSFSVSAGMVCNISTEFGVDKEKEQTMSYDILVEKKEPDEDDGTEKIIL